MTSTTLADKAAIDPDRWPDVVAVPQNRLRGAVAERLVRHAVRSLPLRVTTADGKRFGAGAADRSGLHLVRPEDFYRRLAAGGLIGFGESFMAGDWTSRRPARPADRDGRPDGHPDPAAAAAAAARRGARPAGRPGQHGDRLAGQHPPALRPVQRAVRAVPGPVADLLLGAVRGRSRTQRRVADRRAAPQDRPAARPGRGERRQLGARDRHRLGRAEHPGGRVAAPGSPP